MKRAISLFLAAGLFVGTTGLVAAADPVTVTIPSASLVAKGVAVQVTLAFTCVVFGADGDTFQINTAQSTVSVSQAINKKTIVSGYGFPTNIGVTCDGTTVNMTTALVHAGSVPYNKGAALVEVGLDIANQNYSADEFASVFATVKLR